MFPALIGSGAALAALAAGWLIVGIARRTRRSRQHRVDQRRLAQMQHAERQRSGPPAEVTKEAAVIRDAERSLAEARRQASAIVSEAERKAHEIAAGAENERDTLLGDAGRAAAEVKKDARRTATATVQEGERRAAEIVAAGERSLAELERQLADERARANEKRRELSTQITGLLEELRRTTAGGANGRHASPREAGAAPLRPKAGTDPRSVPDRQTD